MRRTTSTPSTSGRPSNGSGTRSEPAARRSLTGLAGPRILAAEPDERLVELARAGDEGAFRAIVERYRAPLLRYCLGFLPPAAAEDALQQTFINAYAALTRDDGRVPLALRPWLYRVAHNAALNVARDPQGGLAPLPEELDGVERPDEAAQRRERFSRVVGAVRALPPTQRQVIVRHALDGDSHDRIAADLGMSPGAIRQLAHRARRTVRDAAAGLLPVPVLRWLPFGSLLAESAPAVGGGAAAVKVAATIAVVAAGGGAVEATRHAADAPPPPSRTTHVAAVATPTAPARRPILTSRAPAHAPAAPDPVRRAPARDDSSGHGSRGGDNEDSSGPGSGGGDDDTSGTSGSSGSSGSGSSGSGLSGSSGSGSSGSGSSGSGSSGSGSSGSSGPGLSREAVITPTATPIATVESGSGSSGSGSSGSGSSGSGSGGDGSDDDHSGPG
jgi:RNA polymerase sigma factor (sigma-70 family)